MVLDEILFRGCFRLILEVAIKVIVLNKNFSTNNNS